MARGDEGLYPLVSCPALKVSAKTPARIDVAADLSVR